MHFHIVNAVKFLAGYIAIFCTAPDVKVGGKSYEINAKSC